MSISNSVDNNKSICHNNNNENNESPIKVLPYNVFKLILSILEPKDLYSTCLISKKWNIASIEVARGREFSVLTKFINFLTDKLIDVLTDQQKETLSSLKGEKKILEAVNLNGIKSSRKEFEEMVAKVLIDVKDEYGPIGVIPGAEVHRRAFHLAHINFFIGVANKCADADKVASLRFVYHLFAHYWLIDEGIEFARSRGETDRGLMDFCNAFIDQKSFDKAIKVAEKITCINSRDSTLLKIGMLLSARGRLGKAEEVAEKITCDGLRDELYYKICEVVISFDSEGFRDPTYIATGLRVVDRITDQAMKEGTRISLEKIMKGANVEAAFKKNKV